MIGYRNMTERALGNGLKAFVSEFSIAHSISTVMPLKQLINTKQSHAQKVADHMLKTAAILLQMNNAPYEQVTRSSLTACDITAVR